MNHLAHCFLSFDNEDILLGNFIGDYIKGSTWKLLPDGVQKGVWIHRHIDSYTDAHEACDRSVNRIRAFAGRYAPPMVDVLYDHILAKDWEKYSKESFHDFAEKTYQSLDNRISDMPPALQERWPRMLEARFLHGYATEAGMEFVIDRFSRRLPANVDSKGMLAYFFDHLDDFSDDFHLFFPDLQAHIVTI